MAWMMFPVAQQCIASDGSGLDEQLEVTEIPTIGIPTLCTPCSWHGYIGAAPGRFCASLQCNWSNGCGDSNEAHPMVLG